MLHHNPDEGRVYLLTRVISCSTFIMLHKCWSPGKIACRARKIVNRSFCLEYTVYVLWNVALMWNNHPNREESHVL